MLSKYVKPEQVMFWHEGVAITAGEMLELLETRVGNSRAEELENAAREQARITRLRMEKWLRAA